MSLYKEKESLLSPCTYRQRKYQVRCHHQVKERDQPRNHLYLDHGLLREGNGTPFQSSCLENPTDEGAWWAAVHGVTKSRARLSDFTFTFHFHALENERATHSSVLAWRITATEEPGVLLLWDRTESDTTEAI